MGVLERAYELHEQAAQPVKQSVAKVEVRVGGSRLFWAAKRTFDVIVCLLLLPVMAAVALMLLVLDPIANPGPVFFRQKRMGKDCRPFEVLKFRSMQAVDGPARGPEDAVEAWRVTRLGAFLRRTRLDELPQVINVLKGEMSLIGPRPDVWEHACHFCKTIPGYRERHVVRPGISGLAQVTAGYAEGAEGFRRKARLDLDYIRQAGWKQETMIVLKTILQVIGMRGK